jgi:molybdate transport system substrate-binding protein
MGETHDAIPARLARGEEIDVVSMVADALGKLTDERKILLGTRADLARSLIGAAVHAGAPHADLSTPEALKQALLNAKSIAYSDSRAGFTSRTSCSSAWASSNRSPVRRT